MVGQRKAAIHLRSQADVDALPLAADSSRPIFYWDSELKGFGVKATARGKTFVVESRVKGKTVREKIDSCAVISAKEARKRAMGALASMHLGSNPNHQKRAARQRGKTFSELCEEYLHGRALAETTARDYRRHMQTTLAAWGPLSFLAITRTMVEKAYQDAINRVVRTSNGISRTVTPAQANQAFRFARAVFNSARRYVGEDGRPLLSDNPVDVLSQGGLWRRVGKKTRYIKASELKAVWRAIWEQKTLGRSRNADTARDLLILLMFTGLRLNEGRLLRWCDVDLLEGELTIPDPKNHQPHTLPFSNYLHNFFLRRKEAAGDSVWVFPSATSAGEKPIVEYRGPYDQVFKLSGVEFTPHDLRRSFLTYTKELPAKYGPFFTKRLANHKVSDVTAGYVQISREELRKCMQDVTDYILRHAQAEASGVGFYVPPAPASARMTRQVRMRRKEPEKVRVTSGEGT